MKKRILDKRLGRRPFVAAAVLGSWSVPQLFSSLLSAESTRSSSQLHPVHDDTTGLDLLKLPEGFRYASFGWTGDPLTDGMLTPGAHDGMAVIHQAGERLTLCRNHEVSQPGTPFGPSDIVYDANAAGGCTAIEFDIVAGKWRKAWSTLSGTVKNCAGGPTPWGSWLSCEETLVQSGDIINEKPIQLLEPHGYIFEVPAAGKALPVPLKSMGRFAHEAVAVDPHSGIVYETEDRGAAGFYRFVPKQSGNLALGGKLQMLAIRGQPDLITQAIPGHDYEASWVSIENPDLAHTPGTQDGGGVYHQGHVRGGVTFARLEGCWWGNGVCYFVSTSGGRAKSGQIWRYDPQAELLRMIFESAGPSMLDSPDNITVSPCGGLVLCEDGDRVPQKLHSLTADGRLTEFAWNNILLKGERNGLKGDFRGSEWAGAAFSPDGRWLFVNIQDPGISFAITGPWDTVGL